MNIIAIGYNVSGTGLTRVMHSILRRLANRHQIHYLGIGYSGETIRDQGLTIYPTNLNGGDIFAVFQAQQLIEEIHPALLFILHDLWMFDYYLRILKAYQNRVKIVAYIPLDGRITNEANAESLKDTDRVVVYTEFAQNEFRQAFDRLRQTGNQSAFPEVEIIPHGVERTRFYPYAELQQAAFAASGRTTAKRKVFGDFAGIEDSFIVLNASRPDPRKRLDLTIQGFAQFATDKPANVRLCLHHAILGEMEASQINTLIRQFNLEERLFLNPLAGGVIDDRELNLLYNACDVGINTSMGEGWGLVSFEHGASGAAQIVPDHTACGNLWRGQAELLSPSRNYQPEFSVLEMSEVSAEEVARALDKLYRNPIQCQELGQAAFKLAQHPAYSWDKIAEQFDDLFIALGKG